jgi:hypothetical protein
MEATAKPKMAIVAPHKNNVFISDKGFGLKLPEPLEKNRSSSLLQM